jgi:tetratricopeptide (TPR) repeat protein
MTADRLIDPADPNGELARLLEEHRQAMDSGRFQDAQAMVPDLFSLAEQWSEQNPSVDHDLTLKADDCQERGDWEGAVAAHRAVLAIQDLNPMRCCSAHGELRSLFRLLNRNDEALLAAQSAVTAARQADSEFLLAGSLQALAVCLMDRQEFEQSAALLEEALSILPPDLMYDQMRATTWVLRAECGLLSGKLDGIQADLAKARAILEPAASSMAIAGGLHTDLARWWRVMAQTHAACGETDATVMAWQNAVQECRHVVSLPHTQNVRTKAALAFMLAGLAQAQTAAGRTSEAENTRRQRAALIDELHLPAGVTLSEPRIQKSLR